MENKIKPTYFISNEEANHRLVSLKNGLDVAKVNWYCTVCGHAVRSEILKGTLYTHPLLKTIICKKCNQCYQDGDFSVDEDDTDKYCRWCRHGGELYLCAQCPSGFCRGCITRNLPKQKQIKVEEDGWICFCCNVQPLIELRTLCWVANQMIRTRKAEKKYSNRKLKNDTMIPKTSSVQDGIKTQKNHKKKSKAKSIPIQIIKCTSKWQQFATAFMAQERSYMCIKFNVPVSRVSYVIHGNSSKEVFSKEPKANPKSIQEAKPETSNFVELTKTLGFDVPVSRVSYVIHGNSSKGVFSKEPKANLKSIQEAKPEPSNSVHLTKTFGFNVPVSRVSYVIHGNSSKGVFSKEPKANPKSIQEAKPDTSNSTDLTKILRFDVPVSRVSYGPHGNSTKRVHSKVSKANLKSIQEAKPETSNFVDLTKTLGFDVPVSRVSYVPHGDSTQGVIRKEPEANHKSIQVGGQKRPFPKPEVFENTTKNKRVHFEEDVTIHNYPGNPDVEQSSFSMTKCLNEGLGIVRHFTNKYCEALEESHKDLESLLLEKLDPNNEYISRSENPIQAISGGEISSILNDIETN